MPGSSLLGVVGSEDAKNWKHGKPGWFEDTAAFNEGEPTETEGRARGSGTLEFAHTIFFSFSQNAYKQGNFYICLATRLDKKEYNVRLRDKG